jgi:hypothetical protein
MRFYTGKVAIQAWFKSSRVRGRAVRVSPRNAIHFGEINRTRDLLGSGRRDVLAAVPCDHSTQEGFID